MFSNTNGVTFFSEATFCNEWTDGDPYLVHVAISWNVQLSASSHQPKTFTNKPEHVEVCDRWDQLFVTEITMKTLYWDGTNTTTKSFHFQDTGSITK